jgi:hypothetical protein
LQLSGIQGTSGFAMAYKGLGKFVMTHKKLSQKIHPSKLGFLYQCQSTHPAEAVKLASRGSSAEGGWVAVDWRSGRMMNQSFNVSCDQGFEREVQAQAQAQAKTWADISCDRTTSEMRSLSPNIISEDSRRSENA